MKTYVRELTGGLNKALPRHLLSDNECSECLNTVFRSGLWKKRPGYTLPFSATGDLLDVIEITDFLKNDGTSYLIALTTQHAYSLSGTSWVQELALASARQVTDKWFSAVIGNEIYITNGVDSIYKASTLGGAGGNFSAVTWDTTTDSQGNTGISITRANVVLAVNSRLLFFNTNSSTDGEQPFRMYWTEVADYDRVHSTNFLNLDYSPAPIIHARILGSGLIAVYKTDSVVTVQNTGDPPFMARFRAMVGLLSPKAVCDVPDGHFFVGTTGFYLYNAGRVVPIGDAKVVPYFFDSLNYSAKDNVYCFSNFRERELYILYPSGASTQPDKVLVYNWNYDTWSEWNFNAWCGFYRYITENPPAIYYGDTGGNVRKSGGTTDNGSAISTKIRTKSFVNILDNPLTREPSDYVHVTRLISDVSPSTASLVVGTHDSASDTPQEASATVQTETGKTIRADFDVFGRFVTAGADNFDSVSEFLIEWREAGDT